MIQRHPNQSFPPADAQQAVPEEPPSVPNLQSDAWSAYNRSYHVDEPEEYRRAGRKLYDQAITNRIHALFSRGDEQNSIIEAHLNQ